MAKFWGLVVQRFWVMEWQTICGDGVEEHFVELEWQKSFGGGLAKTKELGFDGLTKIFGMDDKKKIWGRVAAICGCRVA